MFALNHNRKSSKVSNNQGKAQVVSSKNYSVYPFFFVSHPSLGLAPKNLLNRTTNATSERIISCEAVK